MAVRINKYLAEKGYATRKGADELIQKGVVFLNGRRAVLGDKIEEGDKVEVRGKRNTTYRYFAYNKARGTATEEIPMPERGLFPIGRLDKASHGLIILTDDGRITERLLSPDRDHEKEYKVRVREGLPSFLKKRMEEGVRIEGAYTTKPSKVSVTGEHTFAVTLTEGKKHQVRRMCEAFRLTVVDLERVRIMNVRLGRLPSGTHRAIEGAELKSFVSSLGL